MERMEEICQAHPEKSSDLMGKLSIFYVGFWVENVRHGLLRQSDVTDLLQCECFFGKELKMPALGECDEWRGTDFSVLMEV